ncbi:mediator of RNA polymerase II transcription subunit 13 isoform X1 [Drosophila rhopaloa]|uniref:Mediator of RNA polymerase II transcription subunit 13 n=1 Tax=Drosophila rhopaloa TaxID=1041015 RepID=A0ABM5HRT5_DRORH|nr:mediator of RNA polymerase II transcription subunit 13 isoform X1 [Drosophila rhopaloa]XP_016984497.2 mediator of RNA polymerase II transcription subunit 13 isoform X1 [Drosophila rhopaloa]XP_016984498.2 mediator of RNA polymerase II transcription subunit 13 isoform X1 [Drosophila rhopaloa]XP_016984499.2 mediator of RNA polymerase II transcription subunit 13 isoform X1 [Drosophila rhopaloa]XP_016984500.2 mediator of RNA polymerase II transcription subunit 13 isoform X1 [Drosophila rhopaloa]
MTHQNHQTNGASLEDCHTNFYALTDLCGIKWKKFVNGERPNASSDPLADPILRSYSRCIQADMLCVWRRVQSTKTDNAEPNALTFEITTSTKVHPPLSLAAAKELWIFWYGEEPDLNELVDAELIRVAANQALWNGTWKGALTYECRSLLFKALHNLMERFVLTKDIVRFGKWFVQPCTSSDRLFGRSSQHLSFSFTFFVHGDTVCASIDLREHPAVRPLTKEHLAEAAAAFAAASSPPGSAGSAASAGGAVPNPGQDPNGAGMEPLDGGEGAAKAAPPAHARKVMLAPFGIAAILTGNSYKASDPIAEKILEDWASFFPLCNKDNTDVPPVVEVVSGGHKMYHPTNYVLVTDLDDMEHMEFVEMQKMQSSVSGAAAEASGLASLSYPPGAAAAPPSLGAGPSATAIPMGPASLNAPGGGAVSSASSASAKEVSCKAAPQAVSALERLAFQPYYDQRPTSGFTFNTNNTHIPASAAVEMPERTWQDCVMNTLHVDAAAAAAAMASSTPSSGTGASTDGDENEQNKPPQQDSKQQVQQQIQQQQQQQRQKLWNFVDPMQKAPCICTNAQCSSISSNSNISNSHISNISNNKRPQQPLGSPALRAAVTGASGNKSSSSSSSSSYQQHYHQQHLQQQQRPGTPVPPASASAAAAAATSHHSSSLSNTSASNSSATALRRHNVPFHKRLLHSLASTASSSATFRAKNHSNTTTDTNIPKQRHLANTPHGTPHGGASTYSRNSLGGDSSMPVASVESPATPAPSPHPNSAHSQPTSVPPAEQLLNMSPHAPTSVSNLQQPPTPIDHLLDKNTPAPTPTDQHDNKSITASPYVHQTPSVEPPSYTDHASGGGAVGGQSMGTGPGSVPAHQPATPTAATSAGSCGGSNPVGGSAVGTISVKKLEMQQQTPSAAMAIKQEAGAQGRGTGAVTSTAEAMNDLRRLYNPPKLTLKDPDSFYDDEWLKEVIYDFQYQENWDHPSEKRPKLDKQRRPRYAKNLYEGHTHVKPLMPSPGSVYGSQLLSLDVSATSAGGGVGGSATGGSSGGLVGIANSTANGSDAETESGSSFFQGLDIKTEPGLHSPTCKETSKSSGGGNSSGGGSGSGGNLFTAEGLNPSLNDLEQLFETSSNDECSSVQIHTPPDSNNPSNGGCSAVTNTIEDLKRSTAVASAVVAAAAAAAAAAASGAGNIQAEDLTKMFPTPPSHEQQHPNSSPCQTDVVMTDLSVDTTTNSITSSSITTTCNTTITSSINTTTGCTNTNNTSIILAAVQAPVTVVAIQTVSKLVKQEYNLELGSPVEEPIDDWNFVYRPPQQEKFVGSTRYAPLTNLPSLTQPPLSLPPGCIYQPTWSSHKSRAVTLAKAAAAQQQQHQKHQALQQRIQLHQQKLQQLQHQHHQQQQQQAAAAAAAAAAGGVGHQKHQHQHLHDLLSAAPRTPLTPSTVPQPLSSGGSQLLLNQLNCPQAPPGSSMQQLMQRAGMSPISPGPGMSHYGARSSPMSRATPTHPPPPYPYDLAVASPATSTSSYLNRPLHSQEHPHMHGMGGGGAGGVGPGAGAGGHMGMMPYTGDAGIASGGPAVAAGPSSLLQELPEVNSVLVNILLYDTALNVFRDHNFDSSSVCVCNADTQKIGNIRGADSGVYVPLPGVSFNPFPTGGGAQGAAPAQRIQNGPSSAGFGGMRMISAFGGSPASASMPGAGSGHGHGPNGGSNSSSCTPPSSNVHITGYVDDDPVECTCGFSAVVNRRLSHRAGLFYEDEVEITGIADDPGRNKQPSLLSIIQSLGRKNQIKPGPGETSSALEKAGAGGVSSGQLEQLAHAIFDLLLDQCSIIQTSSSSVHRALQSHRRRMSRQRRIFGTNGAPTASLASIANVLEFMDAHDVISLALEQARLAFENQRMDNMMDFHGNGSSSSHQQQQLTAFHVPPPALRHKLAGIGAGRLTVHKWPYLPVGFTRSNKEIVRTMNAIQPMLQSAFHCKSRGGSGSKDASSYNTVSGPLTWRQFHRLAGRASGQCEPQPIPSVVVGYEKDWISVAPHSIHYWDKFLLEPYSYARDVVYMVVCPDNEHVAGCTRSYFRELSSTYEMCKLGKHTPIRGWEGILQVGASRNIPTDREVTPLDDWLRTLEHTALAEQIRRYAVAFIHQLAPYLSRVPNDKTLLNPPDGSGNSNSKGCGTSSSNTLSSTGLPGGDLPTDNIKLEPGTEPPVQPMETNEIKQEAGTGKGASAAGDSKPALILGDPLGMGETLEDINPSAIVLYVVNPFTFASDSCELERLALIALLRCYAELLKAVPDSVRAQMNIQIISLESVMELGPCGNRRRFSDEIKCLALNIFSQCRRHLVHAQSVKSLTGFGTAAKMEAFLKTKDEPNRRAYKMYTAPFVLAPMHERNDKTDFSRSAGSMHGQNEHRYSVMYCNYCLSEDQAWLLATATDERGELLEKICINIDVPNRARRRKAPARYVALKKLMDFIMGIISQTSQMWRLVIGRIGRIGHSELKSWSYLLSKQQLQKASKQFKDMCKQCTLMYPPTILSACLVTLEPDAKLRVMPDQFTPDERFSQISMQNPLATPQDVTCTHILVFPTSAVCAPFTRQFQNEPQVEDDFLNFEEEGNDDFSDAEIGDFFWDPHIDRVSNHGSPGRMDDNRSWQSAGGNNFKCTPPQEVEEVGSLNQQPISVGYMVSTAPTGRMPAWFWSACPHLEDVCPVFLKTALHLHVPSIQTADDILNSTNAHQSANDHPLDSILTADVLRFVLEGYNALSWLALDSNTHDRLSCLPINVQTLMDLYYLTAAIA